MSEGPASLLWRRDEINDLSVISPVDAEVGAIDCNDLALGVKFTHDDDGRVGKVHLFPTFHQRSHTRPMHRQIEVNEKRLAFDQLE